MAGTTSPDIGPIEQARQELLAIHAADRAAHFARDAAALLSHHPETFISVTNGVIQHVPIDNAREGFEAYFKNATYYEWDDLEPPIVRVSQDASMGWMIVRNKVRRVQVNDQGVHHEREFIYAGIMTYERQDGTWVRVANVSTFEHLKT